MCYVSFLFAKMNKNTRTLDKKIACILNYNNLLKKKKKKKRENSTIQLMSF